MMDCKQIKEQISAYLDNELSPETNRLVREHIKTCEACRTFFGSEKKLEQKLVEIISQPSQDDKAAWQKAVAFLYDEELKATPVQSISVNAWFRRLRYLIPLSSAALVMIVLSILFFFPADNASALLSAAEQIHQTVFKPEFRLALKTDSPETLIKEFDKQYNFNIAGCGCFKDKSNYNLKGGGMCSLKNRPTAHIVIDYQGTPVSLLVLSENDLTAFPDAQAHLTSCHKVYQAKGKNFNCAMVRLCDNIVCAVGAVSPDVLGQLLTDTGMTIKHCDKCPME